MKKIIVLTVLFVIFYNAHAQEDQEPVRKHEFGIHAGFVTGVGLAYRYWPGKLGFQIAALPVKTDEETFLSLGITGLFNFYENRRVRFFGYLGNHLYHMKNKDYNYSIGYDYYEYKKSTEYSIGFGPGFGFGTRVRFNIMAGYGFYNIFGKLNIMPTGEIGLYYRL